MKTVLVDNLTNSVVCYTDEKRVVPLIKMIVLDVNPRTLFPMKHQEWYNTITTEFIKNNMIRHSLHKGVTTFTIVDDIPKDTLLKKKIAMKKTSILETVIKCADAKINNSHTFFNTHLLNIIERNDESLLEEYCFVRKLPLVEVRKDLLLRKSLYETHLVKSQALIDLWVDKITFETDIEILNSYTEKVADSFFRHFKP
jgi:hypothetical protein